MEKFLGFHASWLKRYYFNFKVFTCSRAFVSSLCRLLRLQWQTRQRRPKWQNGRVWLARAMAQLTMTSPLPHCSTSYVQLLQAAVSCHCLARCLPGSAEQVAGSDDDDDDGDEKMLQMLASFEVLTLETSWRRMWNCQGVLEEVEVSLMPWEYPLSCHSGSLSCPSNPGEEKFLGQWLDQTKSVNWTIGWCHWKILMMSIFTCGTQVL